MSELQSTKAQLENNQARIVGEIQTIRREARDYSLRVGQSHEVQDPKEAERRRAKIAQLQGALMGVQSQLAEVNRALRANKPSQLAHARSLRRQEQDRRQSDFLAMFLQIARDSLDPRQFAALEAGARALLQEAERMEVDNKGDHNDAD
jgi:hypothetical protein